MTKQVLNVGQCGPDHASISRMLKSHFDVAVDLAETHEEAVIKLQNGAYDLVLLNRVFDATGTEGMLTLQAIKAQQSMAGVPVMLVSNYQDAQQKAVAEGALPGFGKSQLADPLTTDRLQAILGE